MAEGAFLQAVSALDPEHRFEVDSAGTHAGQFRRAPDPRAQKVALSRGIDIAHQRSRNVTPDDFHLFDYILELDKAVMVALQAMAPPEHGARVQLLMIFAAHMGVDEVPDPWHGTHADYEHALDLISEAAHGLAEHLTQTA